MQSFDFQTLESGFSNLHIYTTLTEVSVPLLQAEGTQARADTIDRYQLPNTPTSSYVLNKLPIDLSTAPNSGDGDNSNRKSSISSLQQKTRKTKVVPIFGKKPKVTFRSSNRFRLAHSYPSGSLSSPCGVSSSMASHMSANDSPKSILIAGRFGDLSPSCKLVSKTFGIEKASKRHPSSRIEKRRKAIQCRLPLNEEKLLVELFARTL
jgi:hypothetical protein